MPAYFSWGDVRYPAHFSETWKQMFALPSMWTHYFNGYGDIDLLLTSYPTFNLLFSGLATLGFDPRLILKIVYLIPISLYAPLGSFVLIRHFAKNNLAGFVGSLAYSYNVYTLITRSGDLSMSASYAFTPIILFTFIKTIETHRLKTGLLCGLLCLISSTFDFRIMYVVAFIMIFYVLYHLLFIKTKTLSQFKTLILYSSIPFIVLIGCSFYWILPLFTTGSLSNNVLFNRNLFGNDYASLRQSVAYFFPWWTAGNGYALGVVQPIPNYFWIIPIIVVLGIILNYKHKYVVYFTFLSLLGILLTKQSDYPFPNLYLWLFKHFPGFNAFREASKFYVILAIGYSQLIGSFISWVDSNLKKGIILTPLKSAIVCSISCIFLINTLPLINGNIQGLFSPKYPPQDYYILKEYLKKDNSFSRTLWVPSSSLWGYFDTSHPIVNLYLSYFNDWEKIIKSRIDYVNLSNTSSLISNVNHQQLNFLGQSYSGNMLNILGIGYVVVPTKDVANDDDVFTNYGLNDKNYVIKYLDSLPFLKRVDIGTHELILYKNYSSNGLVYLVDNNPSIYNSSDGIIQKVTTNYISSTEYQIHVDGLNSPKQLIFSQTYSPGWALYLNNEKTNKSLLPDYYHDKLDSNFNSFYLSPELVKKIHSENYNTNSDGSISFDATIYFRPQNNVYAGLIISLISLVTTLYFLTSPNNVTTIIFKAFFKV